MSRYRPKLPNRQDLGMTEDVCSALLGSMDWTNFESIFSLAILLTIDISVIAGNTMVIMAVYFTSKLRSVTNLFIVSLAVADLMVGLVVLPFSAVWEVFKVWIFGNFLCSMWLAVDVWMCTASILNLCAISLDRYVAVTRPITYPNIMSMRRTKILIACVWMLSFIICLPPLIGWRDTEVRAPRSTHFTNDTSGKVLNPDADEQPPTMPPCPWICELTSDTGYVVYSALGSFYIPTFVMLFFYWKIYRAAAQTTKAINQGFRTTKPMRNQVDESCLTLRIHRGRGSSVRQPSSINSSCTLSTTCACNSSVENSPCLRSPVGRLRRASTRKICRGHDKVKISVNYPSTDCLNKFAKSKISAAESFNRSGSFSCPSTSGTSLYVHHNGGASNNLHHSKDAVCRLRVGGGRLSDIHLRRCSTGDTSSKSRHLSEPMATPLRECSLSPSVEDNSSQKPKLITKMGKRNIKAQVKRFRMETKAAKTLGIIVGGFIFCWLPFFTLYLARAFCDSCIHPMVFSVMFWLGYCNSAINPMIYALFSKEFRFAFQRIIYSSFSKDFTLWDSKHTRRGSSGSQLGAVRRNDRSLSCNEFPMTNVTSCSLHSESEPSFSKNR